MATETTPRPTPHTTPYPPLSTLHVAKGHGTRNDFVLVPDAEGNQVGPLWPELVRALADRRAGVGSDGVIRVVRTSVAIAEGILPVVEGDVPEWFMDYWNADGTTSEMCGNGVRVFARYLLNEGLATAPFTLYTRGGVKTAEVVTGGDIRVGMGQYALPVDLAESVATPGLLGAASPGRSATSVNMGNPHTVTIVDAAQSLAALDLTAQPQVTPEPVAGTNIEFVQLNEISPQRGALTLRVHERGVGETEACGTGACAAAVAAYLHACQEQPHSAAPREWDVAMPGGVVTITIEADHTTYLAGPAEIVASLTLDTAWLAARGFSS